MDNAVLDTAGTLADYRALRDGTAVVEPATVETPSEAPPDENPDGDESGAGSEPADETVEEKQDSEDGGTQESKEEKKPQKKGLVDEVIKLRRELREVKARVTPPPPQEQPKPAPPAEGARVEDAEPDINKYADYNLYNRDLIRWELRQEQKRAAAEQQRIAQQNAQQERMRTWQGRISSARAEFPDFEAVALNESIPVTPVMGDAIMASELGPRVLYHLGSHPEEAARIAALEPIAQIRELTKLEVSLTPKPADASEDDTPTPPRSAISKAPPPIPRPAASSTARPSARNLEGISQREYRALRESGKLR